MNSGVGRAGQPDLAPHTRPAYDAGVYAPADARRPPLPPPTANRSRTGAALALLLSLGALAIVLAGVRSDLFDLERHLVPKELALHVSALACAALLVPRWQRIEPGAVAAAWIAFVAWSAVSALFATNHWLAFPSWGVSFSGLIIYHAAARAAREGAGPIVIGGLAFAAIIGAALGAGQAYGLDWPWLADSRAPGATFGNRNFLAHLIAIATPLLLFLALRARTIAGALPWLLGAAVAALTLVLTRSRAAWLAIAAALAVMAVSAWIARRRRVREPGSARMLAAAAFVAVAAAAAILLPNQLRWNSDSPYAESLTRITDFREGSGRGRLIQYRNSMGLVAADPLLGTGPGNWFVHYPLVTTPGDPSFAGNDPIPTNPWPSSDWVAMMVERGPIGALLLTFAGAAAALIALRRLRSDEPGVARRCIAVLGVVTAAFVAGLFDAVLLLAAPTFFVAAALGALLPATAPVTSRPLEGAARRALVFVVPVLLGLQILYAGGRLASILITNDDQNRATLERAVRFDPGSHRLRLLLARRGGCSVSLPHARAVSRLMPFHDAPRAAMRRCGE